MKAGRGALALVGMPGAGKSVCAEHLQAKGYFSLRFGAVVVDEVRRRGLAVNPQNERIVREELRQAHGMAAMAVISLPRLQGALRGAQLHHHRRPLQLQRIQAAQRKTGRALAAGSDCSAAPSALSAAGRARRSPADAE